MAAAVRSAAGEVRLTTRPLWRLRIQRQLPRYVVSAVALAGLLASARFAIAPPRPAASPPPQSPLEASDLGAEAYAAQFARRYLTWSSAEPLDSARSLEAFSGPEMEPAAGLRLPPSGEQRVEWLEVVQARQPVPDVHVYTVAAQTDTAGVLYLSVPVERERDGTLALAGYPAFVGSPSYVPARLPSQLRDVTDVVLATVVERGLRNYLSGSEANLDADLASGARVSLPGLGLELDSVAHLYWAAGGGAVLALVQAHDARGVRYSLAYEVDVTQAGGRWEIAAVQMDPNS
jgi:hypothetical protein